MWLNSIPLAFSNSSSFWQQKEKQSQQQEPLLLYYAAAISTAAAEHNRARRNTKKRAETFQPLAQKNPNKKINKQTKKNKKMGKCLLTKFNFVSMVSLLPAPGARDSRKDS